MRDQIIEHGGRSSFQDDLLIGYRKAKTLGQPLQICTALLIKRAFAAHDEACRLLRAGPVGIFHHLSQGFAQTCARRAGGLDLVIPELVAVPPQNDVDFGAEPARMLVRDIGNAELRDQSSLDSLVKSKSSRFRPECTLEQG
jgi:hypothetical protein